MADTTNNVIWVGMLVKKSATKRNPLFSSMHEAWVIEQGLRKHNAQLICFPCENVDFEKRTVTGYIFKDGAFTLTTQEIPLVSYDFYFTGGAAREIAYYNAFEPWAVKEGYVIMAPKDLRRISCNKVKTADHLMAGRILTPVTERYWFKMDQLEKFVQRYSDTFVKPVYGNRGNNIFVIHKKESGYTIEFHSGGKTTIENFPILKGCFDFIEERKGDRYYLLQEAVDVYKHDDSVFSLRMIVYHDGMAWRMINRFFMSRKKSDISNEDQGGKHYDMEDILPTLFSPEIVTALMDKMKAKTIEIAEYMNDTGYGPINDFAIDFLLDKQFNLSVGEINVKPGMAGDNLTYTELMNMTPEEKQKHHMRFDHGQYIGEAMLALHHQHCGTDSKWLGDLHSYVELTKPLAQQVAALIMNAIEKRTFYVLALPECFPYDDELRMVFITLTDNRKRAKSFWGMGYGLLHAINTALEKAKVGATDLLCDAIRWDLVQEVKAHTIASLSNPMPFDQTLKGFAFDADIRLAFLPDQVMAHTIINNEHHLNVGQIREHFSLTPEQKSALTDLKQFTVYAFDVQSFYYSHDKCKVLYRGHPLYMALNSELLWIAANAAGKYLQSAVKPNGTFDYEYLPKRDLVTNRYNILRHAGTIYAMLEWYTVNADPTLLSAAKKALTYLMAQIKTDPNDNTDALCVVEDDTIKLGGNAITLLALSTYFTITQDFTYLDTARGLARWMVATQNDKGAFKIYKQRYSSKKIVNFISEYYPGEAIFALASFYQIDPNPLWIESAEKAADFIIQDRDYSKTIQTIAHDHWLLYGLNALFQEKPKTTYIAHTQKISQAIIQAQYQKAEPLDYLGSFYDAPRSTPTAIRAEGLSAAYSLLKNQGYLNEAKEIKTTIEKCIRFQLQNQYTPERTLFFPNPQRAWGGVSKSLTDFSIRIDYVQHHLSSLIGLYKILKS